MSQTYLINCVFKADCELLKNVSFLLWTTVTLCLIHAVEMSTASGEQEVFAPTNGLNFKGSWWRGALLQLLMLLSLHQSDTLREVLSKRFLPFFVFYQRTGPKAKRLTPALNTLGLKVRTTNVRKFKEAGRRCRSWRYLNGKKMRTPSASHW